MTTSPTSGLKYFGTTLDVCLGDHVEVRGWFGVKYCGYVSYIPSLSEKHGEIEYDDVRQWAITSDDGTTYPILFDPENFQPPKHIRFVKRGSAKEIKPHDELN